MHWCLVKNKLTLCRVLLLHHLGRLMATNHVLACLLTASQFLLDCSIYRQCAVSGQLSILYMTWHETCHSDGKNKFWLHLFSQ